MEELNVNGSFGVTGANDGFGELGEADLTTTPATAATDGKSKGKRTKSTADATMLGELQESGKSVLLSSSAEELAKVSSESDTLFFKKLVVLTSQKKSAIKENNVTKSVPLIVGGMFESTKPISVPVIPLEETLTTGAKNVGSREVPANTPFILTQIEVLYLLARTEYSNCFKFKSGDNIVDGSLQLHTTALTRHKAVLPTPTYSIVGDSARSHEFPLDTKNAEGAWVLSEPENEECKRFAALLQQKPKKAARSGASTKPAGPKFTKPQISAAAVRQLLGM